MSETTTHTPQEVMQPSATDQDAESLFEILNHENAMGRFDSQEQFLEDYLSRTASMIGRIQEFEMVDGKPVPADVVIFLDKSARPLYWMMNEMWPHVAEPGPDGEIPQKPASKFANIDRLPWRIDEQVEITEHPSNMRQPTPEDIAGLRAIYDVPGHELEGARILIVDEVRDSGDTAKVAQELFSQAYPDATIKSHAWMDTSTVGPRGEKIVKDVPIWYSSTEVLGRGILGQVEEGDETANKSERLTAESHQFLSTRPHMQREMSPEQRERHDKLLFALSQGIPDQEERIKMLAEVERLALYDN